MLQHHAHQLIYLNDFSLIYSRKSSAVRSPWKARALHIGMTHPMGSMMDHPGGGNAPRQVLLGDAWLCLMSRMGKLGLGSKGGRADS